MDGWQSRAIPDNQPVAVPEDGDWRSRAVPDAGIDLSGPPPTDVGTETAPAPSNWRSRAIADTSAPTAVPPADLAPTPQTAPVPPVESAAVAPAQPAANPPPPAAATPVLPTAGQIATQSIIKPALAASRIYGAGKQAFQEGMQGDGTIPGFSPADYTKLGLQDTPQNPVDFVKQLPAAALSGGTALADLIVNRFAPAVFGGGVAAISQAAKEMGMDDTNREQLEQTLNGIAQSEMGRGTQTVGELAPRRASEGLFDANSLNTENPRTNLLASPEPTPETLRSLPPPSVAEPAAPPPAPDIAPAPQPSAPSIPPDAPFASPSSNTVDLDQAIGAAPVYPAAPTPTAPNPLPPASPPQTQPGTRVALKEMLDSDKTAAQLHAEAQNQQVTPPAPAATPISAELAASVAPQNPIELPKVQLSPVQMQVAGMSGPDLLALIQNGKNRRLIDAATAEYQQRFPAHIATDLKAAELSEAVKNINTTPTLAQKEAGNYQKGHLWINGLDISIENPKGSQRTSIGPDGKKWSVTMPDHYGYVKKTEGADGDHMDVYIHDGPERHFVYVVDQIDHATGKFDEHKVLLNYPSMQAALDSYKAAFSDNMGGERIGGVTQLSMPKFKEWLKSGNTAKPLVYKPTLISQQNQQEQKKSENQTPANVPHANVLDDARKQLETLVKPPENHESNSNMVNNGEKAPEKPVEPPKNVYEPDKSPFSQPKDLAETAKLDAERLKQLYTKPIIAMAKEKGIPVTPEVAAHAAEILAEAHQPPVSATKPAAAPKARNVPRQPADALRFLAAKGGIREDGGELRAMDAQKKFIPGLGRLVRPRSMTLDDAGAALHDAGYFGPPATTERPTVNQVLELIRDGLNGKKTHAEADRSEIEARIAKGGAAAYADDLERHADQLGIEIKGLSISQLEEAIRAQEAIETAKAAFLDSLENEAMRNYYAGDKDLQPVYEEPHAEKTQTPAASSPAPQNDTGEPRPALAEERTNQSASGGESGQSRAFPAPNDEIPFERAAKRPLKSASEPALPAAEKEKTAVGLLATKAKSLTPLQLKLENLVTAEVRKFAPGAAPRMYEKLEEDRGDEISDLLPIHGAYYRAFDKNGISHVIAWSLDSENALNTVRHEVIHYLRKTSLITGGEWKVLEKTAVARDWLGKHDITGRYPDFSPETQMEEAVAEEYPDWQNKIDSKFGKLPGAVQRTFRKMDLFRRRVAAGLRDVFGKEPTAEDIFTKIETGEVGLRQVAPETAAKQPDEKPLFQRAKQDEKAPVFYSALTHAVEAIPQEKASAEQWRGIVKNLKGVKEEERAWSGIDDWLKELRGPFTKQAIVDYLRDNEIQVQDVLKGGKELSDDDVRTFHGMSFEVWDNLRGSERTELREEAQHIENEVSAEQPVKYASYQLPGGENYRELLLTLPESGQRKRVTYAEWRDLVGRDDTPEARHEFERSQAAQRPQMASQNFRTNHFAEPNIVAHIRFNDRVAVNEKILHLEELQSDWAQRGRKLGYKKPNEKQSVTNFSTWAVEHGVPDDEMQKTWDKQSQSPPLWQEWEKFRDAQYRENVRIGAGVPDMPYKSTEGWAGLAMRRMVRYAAENGYDKISWTTGEIQAERYDLSKQINRIRVYGSGDDLTISAWDKSDKNVIDLAATSPEKLADMVGKDAADKLLAKKPHNNMREISGLELKVGGEGMGGFYDKILPAIANKLGKKFGVEVGETQLSDTDQKLTFEQAGDAYLKEGEPGFKNKEYKVHTLPINDAMRESVLQGQPLFQRPKKPVPGEPVVDAEENKSAIGKLLSKVKEEAADLAEKAREAYVRNIQPELMSDDAAKMDPQFAKYKAANQQAKSAIERQAQEKIYALDKLSKKAALDLLDAVETGKIDKDSPFLEDAKRWRKMLNEAWRMEKEFGSRAAYRENYLPHIYKDPLKAQQFFEKLFLDKNYGPLWFQKARDIDLIREAIAAGIELRTINPEELVMLRLLASEDMKSLKQLLSSLQAGYVAYEVGPQKEIDKANRIAEMVKSGVATAKTWKGSGEVRDAEGNIWAPEKGYFTVESGDAKWAVKNTSKDFWDKASAKFGAKAGYFEIKSPTGEAWGIRNDIRPLWDNAIDKKSLWASATFGGKVFRGWMAQKSAWVPLKLAASMFHPVHVAHINFSNATKEALYNAKEGGKIGRTASLAGRAVHIVPLPKIVRKSALGRTIANLIDMDQGRSAIEGWRKPLAEQTPTEQAQTKLMVEGGFSPEVPERMRIHGYKNMRRAWAKSEYGKALLSVLPTLSEGMQHPFFAVWIPQLKAAAYLSEVAAALERNPALVNDDIARGVELRKIAKGVDRRFGEMNNDTLFWNPLLKDISHALLLSTGWQLGLIDFAKGITVDPAMIAVEMGRSLVKLARGGKGGKPPPPDQPFPTFDDPEGLPKGDTARRELISRRMLNGVVYLGTAMLICGAMTYYMTGKPPQTATDLVNPNTGELNPDGTPHRWATPFFTHVLPSFLHQVDASGGSWLQGTANFIWNKMVLEPYAELWQNRDFSRFDIGDPNGSLAAMMWDYTKFIGRTFATPISYDQYTRLKDFGTRADKEAAFLGFGPAPSYANQTTMQELIGANYDRYVAPYAKPNQQRDLAAVKRAVRDTANSNNQELQDQAMQAATDAGLTSKQLNALTSDKNTLSEYFFKQLPLQAQLGLFQKMTPDEQDEYLEHSSKKTRQAFEETQ